MSFFKQLKSSIYGPLFYQAASLVPAKEAFKYFSKLISIVALVAMVIFACVFVPVVTTVLSRDNVNKILSQFPSELTLTLKDGKASTNVQEPYIIPAPASAPTSDRAAEKTNLVVIDTKATASMESFIRYSTTFLITSDYIIGEKSNGQVTIQSLKGIPDMTLNRGVIASFAEKILPYLKIVIPFMILLAFIGSFIGAYIINLILLLILTLVVWIVGLIRKTGIGYGTYYKLGLYAITPLVIISMFGALFSLPWYVDWVVFFVLFFINTRFVKQPQL